ncbi:MAG TPA: MBL fold metallo-hydrolase [Gemmatimonadales bacterium]|nr:MBL fold metallo-hydrolase [Gemmatimonadales bacterium]
MRIDRRLSILVLLLSVAASASAQAPRTRVVVLGSGTPIPDPDRAGPAIAVVVDSSAYLFDAGIGVVRRAMAARRAGVAALDAPRLGIVFLTHLHSDHTMGLNDVLFTPWIQGRKQPLEVYGPPGTRALVKGILDGNRIDIEARLTTFGGPPAEGWKAKVHEIGEGTVYTDSLVSIRAFAVPHSNLAHAFGYRITTPDRVIVISGDTRASPVIARECDHCDILLHEVYSDSGFRRIPEIRQRYHAQAHTSATQLGAIASEARPGLLVLVHQLFFGVSDSVLLAEVRSAYDGRVVSAKDLDSF